MRSARIATKHATRSLERLHAELGGKILDNKREAKRLTQAMKHVEAVLKLLQPDYNLAPISVRRRRSNAWFKRGSLLRNILAVLRQAEQPLRAREITERMLKLRDVTDATPAATGNLTKSVLSSLQAYRSKGVVVSNDGYPVRWSIAVPRGQPGGGR